MAAGAAGGRGQPRRAQRRRHGDALSPVSDGGPLHAGGFEEEATVDGTERPDVYGASAVQLLRGWSPRHAGQTNCVVTGPGFRAAGGGATPSGASARPYLPAEKGKESMPAATMFVRHTASTERATCCYPWDSLRN
jgi:hypothetical protein